MHTSAPNDAPDQGILGTLSKSLRLCYIYIHSIIPISQ